MLSDLAGIIRKVTATGHAASLAKGNNIACAAVTILLRTAVRLFEGTEGVTIRAGVEKRGSLVFAILDVRHGCEQYAKAVGDFLLVGLEDVQAEFPDECVVTIRQ